MGRGGWLRGSLRHGKGGGVRVGWVIFRSGGGRVDFLACARTIAGGRGRDWGRGRAGRLVVVEGRNMYFVGCVSEERLGGVLVGFTSPPPLPPGSCGLGSCGPLLCIEAGFSARPASRRLGVTGRTAAGSFVGRSGAFVCRALP